MTQSAGSFPCPCCGFLMFDEPPGSYGICVICDWEDDHVQLRNPSMHGGANKESLWECQQRILSKLPVHICDYDGHSRAADWRPLMEQDCLPLDGVPQTGRDYFESASKDSPPYYWQVRRLP